MARQDKYAAPALRMMRAAAARTRLFSLIDAIIFAD
jgi:hypothetical protein